VERFLTGGAAYYFATNQTMVVSGIHVQNFNAPLSILGKDFSVNTTRVQLMGAAEDGDGPPNLVGTSACLQSKLPVPLTEKNP
jgi:hypothetical protein